MPTRDRPEILVRALHTFMCAANRAGLEISIVVVVDDSSHFSERLDVSARVGGLAQAWTTRFVVTGAQAFGSHGPGASRNRGLRKLVEAGDPHDGTIFFDDDVSFADCVYQGRFYRSGGVGLLREAGRLSLGSSTVLGCGYRGRQDLAILDHIALANRRAGIDGLSPSCSREQVAHEAPGGISGALLVVPRPANEIPKFLLGYNEDYFWLRRMQRDGADLQRSRHSIVHAPPSGLDITARRLSFEQRGEALWCASHGIDRRAMVPDLCDRILLSLAERVKELDAASFGLQRGRAIAGVNPAIQALRRTANLLRRHQASVENYILGRGSLPPIITQLRRIARYCGL